MPNPEYSILGSVRGHFMQIQTLFTEFKKLKPLKIAGVKVTTVTAIGSKITDFTQKMCIFLSRQPF